MPAININVPPNDTPMPAQVVGTFGANLAPPDAKGGESALVGTPVITCSIHRDTNGAAVQTINGQLNVPVAGQWTAPVNLGGLGTGVYFIVAVITQDGTASSAGVTNVFKV